MWRALRDAFPNLRFRRQVPFGPYHADFCAHASRLVIEIDGDTHATTTDYDAARTRFLRTEGYQVIRFTNADVMENIDGVLAHISLSLREKEGASEARKDEGSGARKKGGAA